tara:strand:- start:26449 stop:27201 length:753 start_codon:yes stop_codon:yes gene_type:complete
MRYIIPIYIILRKYNIKSITFWKFLNWHTGYCYFRGVYEEREVFVKIDTKLHLLTNDKIAYDICKEIMQDDLVEIITYSLDSKIQFIAYEFLNFHELDESILLNNMQYLNEIDRILNNLSKLGIIHRDIKLDNFLVLNNKLKIIDFTFAISNINKDFKELDVRFFKNCFILESLGNSLNPAPFVWDDYYSFRSILMKLNKDISDDKSLRLISSMKNADKYIGKNQYNIKCQSRYFFLICNMRKQINSLFE